MGRNLYQILGISKTANDEEIKKAYKRMALKYHPDKNDHPQAAEHFQEVAAAFEVLSNKKKREIYDHNFDEGLKYGSEQTNCAQETSKMLEFMMVFGGTVLVTLAAFKTYQFFTKKNKTHREGDESSSD